jgi:uncharacterized protein YggE
MILRRTAFALLAFVAAMANAQQPSSPPALVSTSGTAVMRVVPDLADIHFEVEIRNFDLGIARQKQAERLVKVLAALRTAEVAESELQSSHVQISPNYTEDRTETEKVRFYSVSQTISCTVHDLKRLPDVIAAAVGAGATSVNRATFRTSELPKHRADARLKAIRIAKEKAIALAAELGAKVGKPHTITESGSYSGGDGNVRFNMNTVDAAGEGEGSANFAPGTIAVSETIHVSFVLE